jgi:hypothetical protein
LVAIRARKPWVRRREILLGLPRPFFTLRSSVQGLSRQLRWPQDACQWPFPVRWLRFGRTSAKDAGAEVYTNLWKMRVPCEARTDRAPGSTRDGRSAKRSRAPGFVTAVRQHAETQRL